MEQLTLHVVRSSYGKMGPAPFLSGRNTVQTSVPMKDKVINISKL